MWTPATSIRVMRVTFNAKPSPCSLLEIESSYIRADENTADCVNVSSLIPRRERRTVKCELRTVTNRTLSSHSPLHLCIVCGMKGNASQSNLQMGVAFLGIKGTATFKACLNKTL